MAVFSVTLYDVAHCEFIHQELTIMYVRIFNLFGTILDLSENVLGFHLPFEVGNAKIKGQA